MTIIHNIYNDNYILIISLVKKMLYEEKVRRVDTGNEKIGTFDKDTLF